MLPKVSNKEIKKKVFESWEDWKEEGWLVLKAPCYRNMSDF
jgi:hypothetical protein